MMIAYYHSTSGNEIDTSWSGWEKKETRSSQENSYMKMENSYLILVFFIKKCPTGHFFDFSRCIYLPQALQWEPKSIATAESPTRRYTSCSTIGHVPRRRCTTFRSLPRYPPSATSPQFRPPTTTRICAT